MDVNVIPVPEPVVHISGTADISREYEDFKLGVRIFADVHIVMTTGSPTGNGEPVNGIENRLDHCAITVSPPLNPDHESIDVPDDLLRQLAVLGQVSADGVEFSGAEMIYNYERVLRQVTYRYTVLANFCQFWTLGGVLKTILGKSCFLNMSMFAPKIRCNFEF